MSGILWLASYPKSGNTWLRAFLANLMTNPPEPLDINELHRFGWGEVKSHLYERAAGRPVDAMTDAEINRLRPEVHRLMAGMRGGDTFFAKTHNALTAIDGVPTITPDATAGAIYVIRNPLDVVPSYAAHFGLSIDDAIEAMARADNFMPTEGRHLFQLLGSWSGHVRSWTTAPGLSLLVLRYEDMTRSPTRTFGRVVEFLGLRSPRPRIERAIRFSSFRVLSGQESTAGFVEKPANSGPFFRQGQVGGWRAALTEAQARRVVDCHGAVMREHGYLAPDGAIAA